MVIVHDPHCADYGSSMRPEQPSRVIRSAAHLRAAHPDWAWRVPTAPVDDETLRLAHTANHLRRLREPNDFDADTPWLEGIPEHARQAVAAALLASDLALAGERVCSLMRPPGHHATANQAMGFCYLNQVAVAALAAQARGIERVAVWDFDAHHGNGTEAILHRRDGILFTSVHQSPGYPGTGTSSFHNCRNWPVAPRSPRVEHMVALRVAFDTILDFEPGLVLVSAGFDAYAGDPITEMSLQIEDFATLGRWLREAGRPAAAILEGGYSDDLPLLIDAFLSAWEKGAPSAA